MCKKPSNKLADRLSYGEIENILKTDISLKEKCKKLVEEANKNGGEDNTTVILAEIL